MPGVGRSLEALDLQVDSDFSGISFMFAIAGLGVTASPTRSLLAILPGLALIGLAGCEAMNPIPGSGTIVTESRTVQEFSGVRVVGAANVVYTVAEEASCEIEADDNLLPLIETVVEDGTLKIQFAGSLQPTATIQVRLAGPPLKSFGIVGSGKFTASEVDPERFDFSITGSGTGELSGQTKQFQVSVSGSGKIVAPELKTTDASVKIAGSGSADLHVDNSLKVSISGSGKVSYSGDATASNSIAGSGKVEKVSRGAAASQTETPEVQ
jgi:carbon monoxide dehydrogenase subunit G